MKDTCTTQSICSRGMARAALPVMPRFAVAAFDSWAVAQTTLHELRQGSKPLLDISYLGLRNVLSELPPDALRDLPFPDSIATVVCSAGPVAEQLSAKVSVGAQSLESALTTWLIPRHAAQLQQTVNNGQIVVWVQLRDPEDERRACRTLLTGGCHSVGVHDLI